MDAEGPRPGGRPGALAGIRICDLSGQLAGAGATRFLAAVGAQVIRVEDPVRAGRWDILRGAPPYPDDRRGLELGGAFNNHNVGKLGVTLNLRTEAGRDLLGRLVAISDVVTENFAAGVFARLGFPYEELQRLRPDVVYVSNSGFGQTGPYSRFKTWGPVVQAMCGLTFQAGLPDRPAAGLGLSYMDHHGANFMAIAVLAGLIHRQRTGEGQHIDMACTEAGALLNGPAWLDFTVNGRPTRRPGMPHSNRSATPPMAPHNIYPCRGEDEWVAIACRDDDDWRRFAEVVDVAWAHDARFSCVAHRLAFEDELDELVGKWTIERDGSTIASNLQAASVPAAVVARPEERIERDPGTVDWGLWPSVDHPVIGSVRVDGIPVHFTESDWHITRGAPMLGEHNDVVLGGLLGVDADELSRLRAQGVV